MLRPARLLPPKRLSTPRSARRLSATNRGLLPGSPAITRTGLPPAGLVQLPGRTMAQVLGHRLSTAVAREDPGMDEDPAAMGVAHDGLMDRQHRPGPNLARARLA